MSSSWGGSWGRSWGDSWGTLSSFIYIDEAIRRAVNANLVVSQPIQYQYSATVPYNYVISQSPAEGVAVQVGTPVFLVVSKGPAPAPLTDTVPLLVGKSLLDARRLVTDAGMTWLNPTWANSTLVAGNTVISQSVAAGSFCVPGTQISCVISAGVPGTSLPGATIVIPVMH